ncbi:hypothetical protein [Bacillus sp. ISL-7]|uniref:hypothetical protein n=1 Tax=Bacillus sp. ISL-7 TaxID=2819136 RepID=UPI001BE5172A|nr:hypothetical protein [Bacillus sp. ISL-7]MBT2737840.1 hypothetical protein [Bacillus sp. ISL-7]
MSQYKDKLDKFNPRDNYIEGLHTNSTYITIAHYGLSKDLLKTQNRRFVTDNDSSLLSVLYHIFSENFRSFSAHQFLCLTDREKSRIQAYQEYQEANKDLFSWGLGK